MDTSGYDTKTALEHVAQRNRQTFDEVLEDYVRQKLAHHLRQLERGERMTWFDASGCVWCVFDDPSFERWETIRKDSQQLDKAGFPSASTCDLQVYWSLGDVLMPPSCDAEWVSRRIMGEACRQLDRLGCKCKKEDRHVEGELHHGMTIRKKWLLARFGMT